MEFDDFSEKQFNDDITGLIMFALLLQLFDGERKKKDDKQIAKENTKDKS